MKKILFLITLNFFTSAFSSDLEVDQETSFSVGTLSINFMWINKSKSNEQLLFPEKQKNNVINSIKGWANKHPEEDTVLNFWYDGDTSLSTTALEETIHLLEGSLDKKQFKKVHLKSIRELTRVKENSLTFDIDTSVYFKTDLLRFIIAKACLEEKACNTFVYADLNVEAEDRKYLFDEQTVNFLNCYGFVMLRNDQGPNSHSSGGHLGFENKFMIARSHTHFLKAVEKILIAPSLLVRKRIQKETTNSLNSLECWRERMEQRVYDVIPWVFAYELHLKKIVLMDIDDELKNEGVDINNFPPELTFHLDRSIGVYWMDNFMIRDDVGNRLFLRGLRNITREYYKSQPKYRKVPWPCNLPIPCKRMTAPRSHFGI